MKEIQVWLIEDNEIYRRGLARALDAANGVNCAGNFDRAEWALKAIDESESPDVILLDVGLPGMNGLEALEEFRERIPSCNVVILTVFNDPDKIFKAVCAGANGYLLKSETSDSVVKAVRQAAEGGAPMDTAVAQRVLGLFDRFEKTGVAGGEDYGLSPREKEVLKQMADGMLTKEIADALSISTHTVTNHIRSLYNKLHVNTNTGAVAKAIREGLV
ncbi:MAG: response regulator transcription factor [Verrucomicrobiota bacterium]